jgi:hypothetical protein
MRFRRFVLARFLLFLAISLVPAFAMAGEAFLQWNPNTEPDLAGYRLYYGTLPGHYAIFLDVGLTGDPESPEFLLPGLAGGTTYYFSVTAYDTFLNESARSLEAAKFIPADPGVLSQSTTGSENNFAEGENRPPVSLSVPVQIVEIGQKVVLDGSLSYDADQDPLHYLWTQSEGTPISLEFFDPAHPEFIPLESEPYAFELQVSDGASTSGPSESRIYVLDRVLAQDVITPESGGSLFVHDGELAGLRVEVPPGAVAEETPFAVGEDFSLLPPEGAMLAAPTLVLEPRELLLDETAWVALPYDTDRYPEANLLEARLYDEGTGEWLEVADASVDEQNGEVLVGMDQLSGLALTMKEEAPTQAPRLDHQASGGYGCGTVLPFGPRGGPPAAGSSDLLGLAAIFLGLLIRKVFQTPFVAHG